MGLIWRLLGKFVRGNWGKVVPTVMKAVADGHLGAAPRAVYWFLAGKKTVIGALLWGAGAALETVCANYPAYAWACPYAAWPYWFGMVLTGLGLADGGTRSPWPAMPDGAPPWQEDK